MTDIGIRKAQKRDLEGIFNLINQLQTVVSCDTTIGKKIILEKFETMQVIEEIYYNFVAEEDNKVVGFVSAVFYQTFFQKNGNGLINELIVHQDYRHQGIGKRLIAAVDQAAKQSNLDGLDVGTEIFNIKAQSFYKKQGFDHQYVLLGKSYQYD